MKGKGDQEKMKKGIALLLLLVVALAMTSIVATGCGGVSQEEAKTQFRSDLQSFETSLQGLANPANYTSTDSMDAAFKDVEKAYNDLVKSAKQVKDTNITALEKAWDELEKAVRNISSSQSLSEKAEAIIKALQDLETTLQQLLSTFDTSQ